MSIPIFDSHRSLIGIKSNKENLHEQQLFER
jgi:hypothetical protein